MRQLLPGILFAMLWASASVATKFGIHSGDPLVLATVRFLIGGSIMLAYAYLRPGRSPWPRGAEWRHLLVFSVLNTSLYLGAFVLAMREVSAGIGSLSTATNPLFITFFSAVLLKRPLQWYEGAGLVLGLAGVGMAAYPLLERSYATVNGLVILLAGMVSVSLATVYYARVSWRLPNIAINGWQVLFGGLVMAPVTLLWGDVAATRFNAEFWGAVLWLVFPVSVAALQLWFYLVRQDAVRASLWLFLCPIFGFLYAYVLMNEPITRFTYLGTALVLGGLYLAQRDKFSPAKKKNAV
jgi:drug/metabolite transporter (DMT)-like permease